MCLKFFHFIGPNWVYVMSIAAFTCPFTDFLPFNPEFVSDNSDAFSLLFTKYSFLSSFSLFGTKCVVFYDFLEIRVWCENEVLATFFFTFDFGVSSGKPDWKLLFPRPFFSIAGYRVDFYTTF